MQKCCWLLTACVALGLLGCDTHQKKMPNALAGPPLTGVELTLTIVDDPAMAEVAAGLQGEWTAQSGSQFSVTTLDSQQYLDGVKPPSDAVICPAGLLGTLAENERIVKMPEKLIGQNAGGWGEIFELVKLREAAWAGETMAVPFGSPVLVCYYRADLLEKLQRQPPKTWKQYLELAELLANPKNLGDAPNVDAENWSAVAEPLGPGWAGLTLLARAAPYARSRENYSTLFDIETMEPLVAGPPFVRALEELVAAAKHGAKDQLQADPDQVRSAFWQGRCGMALTWPSASKNGLTGTPIEDLDLDLVALPGSEQVYDIGTNEWEPRVDDEPRHIPLLSSAGRLGVVNSASTNPEASFQLLLWLSGKLISPQLCSISPATTLYRTSQLSAPQMWTEQPMPLGTSVDYGALTHATLSGELWLMAPRIPGRAEYLAALDAAVHRAVAGEQPPTEALTQAADEWRKITESHGTEAQKQAYLHSWGLD